MSLSNAVIDNIAFTTQSNFTTHPDFNDLLNVTTDPAILDQYRGDRSGWTGPEVPAAVARPGTVAEVQAVLAFATLHRVPVTPRGAGTGLAGGAVASHRGIVLDLSGLNRIVSIDPDNQLAVVEPGVITADLDATAATYGLRYAPDPASAAISTIGGNIATNAGGLRCVKYGVTRDAVRSLDVVLADGRLVKLGATTTKSVAGYDLTQLFVGSEGTLGVIVGATLTLQPIPTYTSTAVAYFSKVEDAANAVTHIVAAGIRPAVAELIDGATLRAIDEFRGTNLSSRGNAFVVVQTDGTAAAAEIELVASILRRLGTYVSVSHDPAEAALLLATRRDALPAIEHKGHVLIEDICVPVSRLAEAIAGVSVIAERNRIPIFTFAHAGDGNLHPIILIEPSNPDPANPQAAADQIFQLALDLGGTVTGEHGVGLLKRAWLAKELDPVALELQRDIKRLFDPAGVLNPGKAI